jgi:hypothetical protein
MTTAGDMIYGGASGTPSRLGIGTAGQVLTVNSGATAPTWQTPSYAPSVSYAGGDLVCAHGGDTSIGSVAITGGTSTSITVGSSISPYYLPGALVGITGATPFSLNGGPYTITSAASNTFNFASLPATWTSGGTIYLYCSNTSDATTSTLQPFSKNTYAVSSIAAGASYTQRYQFGYVSTSGNAPGVEFWLYYGSTPIFQSVSAATLYTNASAKAGSVTWDVVAPSSTQLVTTLQSAVFSGAMFSTNQNTNPITVSGSGPLAMRAGYTATGLGSITSGSAGTISGVGTCTLGTFNNSLTGGAATVTFTTSGSWTGATFAVTNTGYGATAAPTTATLTSGTATCSGTATLVSVLGGAQGNAMLVETLKTTQ